MRSLQSELPDLYIVEVFFIALKYFTHPLTVCNMIIVGSLIFIEVLHIRYHQQGLTHSEDADIINIVND